MTSSPNQPESQEGDEPGRPPVAEANPSAPPPPPPGPSAYGSPPPKQGGRVARVVAYVAIVLLLTSLVFNVYSGWLLSSLMGGMREATYQSGDASQRIVILPVRGMIDGAKADFVRQSLDELEGENEPAAVILRVESGGGGVTASDQIWHQLTDFKQRTDIPIVASFGSAAASGGYYVAMPADHIVAERTGVTGSIGVIGGAFTVDKLMEHIGVTPEIMEAPGSPKKGVGNNPFRSWNEQDRAVWRDRLAQAHQTFVDVVIEGRAKGNPDLSEGEVRELSQGQTFSAAEAKQKKLVDEVGYLSDAIEKAKELAGIGEDVTPKVTEMQKPRGLSPWMFLGSQSSAPELDAQKIRSMMHEISQRRAMYRAPVGP